MTDRLFRTPFPICETGSFFVFASCQIGREYVKLSIAMELILGNDRYERFKEVIMFLSSNAVKNCLLVVVFLMSAFWSAAAYPFGGSMGAGHMGGEAQSSNAAERERPGQPFRILATTIELPENARSGESVTIKLKVVTIGSGSRSVPWYIVMYDKMSGSDKVIGHGTQADVVGGTTFAVTTPWVAEPGRFGFTGYIDPVNLLKLPSADWSNMRSAMVAKLFSDWPAWIVAVKKGVKSGLSSWIKDASFDDVVINGSRAADGRLHGPKLLPLLLESTPQVAPQFVSEAIMDAVAESVQTWADSVKVPSLEWYPAFSEVSGAEAGQAANVVTSLAKLKQDVAPLSAAQLSEAIRLRLGGADDWAEGDNSIDEFCKWLSSELETWRQNAQISGVVGAGPVPSFNPPLVTAGPVVNGKGSGGRINGIPQW